MTALDAYARLETMGVLRRSDADPGEEVVVKFGKSTLTLESTADQPLTHWSLPALHVQEMGSENVVVSPGNDSPEHLTITDRDMLSALKQVMPHHTAPKPTKSATRPEAGLWFLGFVLLSLAILLMPGIVGGVAPTLIPARTRAHPRRPDGSIDRRSDGPCLHHAGG